MKLNDIELTVLIRGRPITEYPHHDQVFIEGRAGSEYEIEVRNNNCYRVEAMISVDGLSVIDGKPAGPQSTGYILDPYKVMRLPGWMLDTRTVAKFSFAGKKASYATLTNNDANHGVVGVMAFREKFSVNWISPPFGTPPLTRSWSQPIITNSMTLGSMNDMGAIATNSISQPLQQQSLGTAFGDATQFATTMVSWTRGDMHSLLLLYYDERRGLMARGIKLERSKPKVQAQPQAFPGFGCTPPPGWQG